MNKSYSGRQAANLAGVPKSTFSLWVRKGLIAPDVQDSKGNYTLFSEAQIERARGIYTNRKTKNDDSNENLFAKLDAEITAETVAAGNDSEEFFSSKEKEIDCVDDSSAVDCGLSKNSCQCSIEGTAADVEKNSEATLGQPAADDTAALNIGDNGSESPYNAPEMPAPISDTTPPENDAVEAGNDNTPLEVFDDDSVPNEIAVAKELSIVENSLVNAEQSVTVESPPFSTEPLKNANVFTFEFGQPLETKSLQEIIIGTKICIRGEVLFHFEAGRYLLEAKKRVSHGDWKNWLKDNIDLDYRTARNYMSVAERFGDVQAFSDLSYSACVRLLSLPEGDEQAFIAAQAAAGKPVAEQSVSQIQSAVKEWNSRNDSPAEFIPADSDNAPDNPFEEKKPLVCLNTGNHEWFTPTEYIEAARRVLGEIDLDPASCPTANKTVRAAKYFTAADDGLKQSWSGRIWLNPPYASGLINQFVDKLVDEYESGNVEAAIVLTDSSTETRWFTKLAEYATEICFATRRIKFLRPDGSEGNGSPTRGSAFFYLGSEHGKFLAEFEQFGWFANSNSFEETFRADTPPVVEEESISEDNLLEYLQFWTPELNTAIRRAISEATVDDIQGLKKLHDALLQLAQTLSEIVILAEKRLGELLNEASDDGSDPR